MTIAVEVPFELHRYIIGQKGSGIRKMMDEFEVGLFTANFGGIINLYHYMYKWLEICIAFLGFYSIL